MILVTLLFACSRVQLENVLKGRVIFEITAQVFEF